MGNKDYHVSIPLIIHVVFLVPFCNGANYAGSLKMLPHIGQSRGSGKKYAKEDLNQAHSPCRQIATLER